jgi:flagellar protein FliS
MTWKTAYLETRVLSADPVELIGISYEFATLRVQEARNALALGDIAARNIAIAKTIAILGELESSLDHELGGEIAFNLGRLYRYMRGRLTEANLKQADEPMAEVESLLNTLGEAFRMIAPSRGADAEEGARGEVEFEVQSELSALPWMESGLMHSTHSWSA